MKSQLASVRCEVLSLPKRRAGSDCILDRSALRRVAVEGVDGIDGVVAYFVRIYTKVGRVLDDVLDERGATNCWTGQRS
jgi:hypothetical protein